MIKLSEIKPNPENPRVIKDDKFKKLCSSIEKFPKMMQLRPIVVDENNIILGGNMRLKDLQHLGFKEVQKDWIKKASELTEEEKKEFIIKDNVGFGEWDWDDLGVNWDADKLDEWGLDVKEKKEKSIEGEIQFSEELDRESNYIVLKFDSDIDFIYLQTILELEKTYSKRANGKPWQKGIGRVVDGIEAIEKFKKS